MAAELYDITIEQGTTFSVEILVVNEANAPIDVTGYSARMQIRSSVDDPVVLLELTDANGRITIGTTDGKITLNLTDSETSAITWTEGVYDLEVIDTFSRVTRVLYGTVIVSPEVTR